MTTEVLAQTARIRVLQIGRGSLTRTMAKQLDRVPFDEIEPMGRAAIKTRTGGGSLYENGATPIRNSPLHSVEFYADNRSIGPVVWEFEALGRHRATGDLVWSFVPADRWQQGLALPLIILR